VCLMSESLERCDHTDIAVVPCQDWNCEDVLRICRDCGEDVEE